MVRESVMANDTRVHERVFHLVVAVPNGLDLIEENVKIHMWFDFLWNFDIGL